MLKRSGRQFAMLSGMIFWRNLITRNAQTIVILKTKYNPDIFYFPGVLMSLRDISFILKLQLLTLDLTNISVQNRNVLSLIYYFLKISPPDQTILKVI